MKKTLQNTNYLTSLNSSLKNLSNNQNIENNFYISFKY